MSAHPSRGRANPSSAAEMGTLAAGVKRQLQERKLKSRPKTSPNSEKVSLNSEMPLDKLNCAASKLVLSLDKLIWAPSKLVLSLDKVKRAASKLPMSLDKLQCAPSKQFLPASKVL